MKLRILPSSIAVGIFSATLVLASLALPSALAAQATPAPDPAQATPAAQTTTPAAPAQASDTQTSPAPGKTRASDRNKAPKPVKAAKTPRSERVKQTSDVKKEVKKEDKFNALAGKDQTLPDKQLYDKALDQEKKSHFDIARLDLQTLLNTYPDSLYQMRAKLAIADCWYHEGGSAALAQAAQEYLDFETFFPNAPESAEAQMRIGDIYFKQMDVPDRDYTKALKAEEAYRSMLRQYPDAPKDVIAQTKQKLREVQEVLAIREASLAAYYGSRLNWPATIARYQTVVDSYPQYSHMDDTLIGLGDAYEAESTLVHSQPVCQAGVRSAAPCFSEAAKAALLQEFDGRASAAYREVVLNHCAAPHVEDAKERLIGMNLPVPTPTAEACHASEELEGSRAQYNLAKRLMIIFHVSPDTVVTARIGEPPMEDPIATTAPAVVRYLTETYKNASDPAHSPKPSDPDPNVSRPAAAAPAAPDSSSPATPAPATTAAAPTLSDVPVTNASGNSSVSTLEAAPASSNSGTGVGVEILSTGNGSPRPSVNTPPSSVPAALGAPDPNHGLPTVGTKDTAALPAVEKAPAAPDQINDAEGKPATAPPPQKAGTKKTKAPATDKNDESSSKKKPKKGLDKLNPF